MGPSATRRTRRPDPAARLLDCRWNRLEALFGFLAKKGVSNVELFGHAAFPADTDIAGLTRYRALLDKYKLHAGGWHGSVTESNWDARLAAAKILGADYHRLRRLPEPGHRQSTTTRCAPPRRSTASASARSRPASASVYFHNHQQEFRNRYVDNGVRKTAWQIVHGAHRPALRVRRDRRRLGL